ncbi:MAG: hypothetical protein Q8Q09_05860 [Deltaproteobacteria bacterium]|nr:hypothetical protein [Deltaproteobacteria bacterium]
MVSKLKTASSLVLLSASIFASGGALAQQSPPRADAGVSANPSAISLVLRFTPGQRNVYAMRVQQQMAGLRSSTSQTLAFETLSVTPAGVADIRARTTAFDIQSGAMTTAVRQQFAQAMMGAVFQYQMDGRGRMVSRQPVRGLPPVMASMGEQLLQNVEQTAPLLPTGPVTVGQRWTDTKTVRMAMGSANLTLRIELQYTLRELRRVAGSTVAVLATSMTLSVPSGLVAPNVTATGAGTATGEVLLAVERGVVQQSSTNLTLNVTTTTRGRQQQVTAISAQTTMQLQG